MLLNGQDHETMHLGQSLSCLSIVNSLNLIKESCHLDDEQTKAGKGDHCNGLMSLIDMCQKLI